MPRELTPGRVRAARVLAVLADAAQWVVFPVLMNTILEPVNLALDVVMAIVLVALIGWHWALLPAFISESIPFLDLVPTWTAAVFLATRGASGPPAPPPPVEVLPPSPGPTGGSR
jgi:hypothetical protein